MISLLVMIGLASAAILRDDGCYDFVAGGFNTQFGYDIHFSVDDTLSQGEMDSAVDGMEAWESGWDGEMRGAAYDITFDGDTSSPANANSVNEIMFQTHSWFNINCPGEWSCSITYWDQNCTVVEEWDIMLDQDRNWAPVTPSRVDDNGHSVGQTVAHEFGHVFGFADDDFDSGTTTESSIMNSEYPYGGDSGPGNEGPAVYRITVDVPISTFQYNVISGLADNTESWGFNRGLSRYIWGTSKAYEVWTDDNNSESGHTWSAHPAGVITSGNMPSKITAWQHGITDIWDSTWTSYCHAGISITWSLEPDGPSVSCPDTGTYVVGGRNITAASLDWIDGYAAGLKPTAFQVPGNTPLGDYRLCAHSSPTYGAPLTANCDVVGYPGATNVDTSNVDDFVMSEKIFTVN